MELSSWLNTFEKDFHSTTQKIYSTNEILHQACRYALEGKGKRIRPALVMLCNQAVGGKAEQALKPAIAIEMLHTYSLVHDDLPAMDDDSLRRGRPTVHTVHNEATGILVGDALLTDSFALLSDIENGLAMIQELALAAGGSGMVLGQQLDMLHPVDRSLDDIQKIHLLKTGRLLGSSCTLGAISGGVLDKDELKLLQKFGQTIGLAFQINDDLLDADKRGKTAGKDQSLGKTTYLNLLGKNRGAKLALELTEEALSTLKKLGPNHDLSQLENFVCKLANRTS